jgi:hypothetical protein
MSRYVSLVALALLGLGIRPATADDGCGGPACCARCGRHAACVQKVSQVVCEIKKETKTCWNVECQEVCPLRPACHHGCCECVPPPRCGNPRCVKKLVKQEYQVAVPVYKCVVLYLCPQCCREGSAPAPATTDVAPGAPEPPTAPAPPPPPALKAK